MANNTFIREFVFFWKIENLRHYVLPKGKCLKSPIFTLNTFLNTSWHLKFYPNGCKNSTEGYVSCYLHRESDISWDDIDINFELSMGKVSYSLSHVFPASGQSWGHRHFRLLPLNCDSKVIKCHMRLYPAHNVVNIRNKFLKCEDPVYGKALQGLMDSLGIAIEEGKKKVLSNPAECFAISRCLVEKQIYIWPIDINILNECCSQSKVIPFHNILENNELFMELYHRSDNGKEYLSLKLNFFGMDVFECPIVICKVSLLDSGIEITEKIEERCVFPENKKNHIWPLDCSFEIKDLKQKLSTSVSNKLKLCFELEFAFRSVYSKIEWQLNQDCSEKDCYADRVSPQISRLYDENKFCDVIIKTENRTYNVHKTVICAMSPVFSAMFSNGMTENDTNTISINNVDEDTVGEMIYFMYTGKLKKLEFNFASKLLVAADRYQILSLKNICRDFIIHNMAVENVYEVLILPIIRTDTKLKWSVLKFVSVHKSTVLQSSEWKKFETKNLNLAVDFLREICLQLPTDNYDPICHINSC